MVVEKLECWWPTYCTTTSRTDYKYRYLFPFKLEALTQNMSPFLTLSAVKNSPKKIYKQLVMIIDNNTAIKLVVS